MSFFLIYLYIFCYLNWFIVFCDSKSQSFNVVFYDDSGKHIFSPLKNNYLWIRFSSKDNQTDAYWIKIEQEIHKTIPFIIKGHRTSTSRSHYSSNETQCHYRASTPLIPLSDGPSNKDFHLVNHLARNLILTPDKYFPISLCNEIKAVLPIHNRKMYVQLNSNSILSSIDFNLIPHITDNISETFLPKSDESLGLLSRAKRALFKMPVRREFKGPYLVELYIIVDHKVSSIYKSGGYYELIGRLETIINQINHGYSQLNIFFVVVQVEIWEYDQVQWTSEDNVLFEVRKYKRSKIVLKHDCLHIIVSSIGLGKSKRGEAIEASMCEYDTCVGYTKDFAGSNVLELAHSMMHELGHNFGLKHDNELCNCYGCIMGAGVEFGSCKFQWSDCSTKAITGLLDSGLDKCLKDYPTNDTQLYYMTVVQMNQNKYKIFNVNLKQCGNGVVDADEECDCGGEAQCNAEAKHCCNPSTCRFKYRAKCAGGACCDLSTCQFKSSGTVCRMTGHSSQCDLPEYCDGESEWCPRDVYKVDGTNCVTLNTRDRSHCYHGKCESAASRCYDLYGETARVSDYRCFAMNSEGDTIKNCGIIIADASYNFQNTYNWDLKLCNKAPGNNNCGRLWCSHENERVLHPATPTEQFTDYKGDEQCSGIKYPMDTDYNDYGMVPNGVQCGYNKLCMRGDCVDLEKFTTTKCYCNGNGICNNLGNCHCNLGFAPPNCTMPGHGGSFNSGPPNKFDFLSRRIVIYTVVPILIIITGFILTVLIYHYRKQQWPPIISKLICDYKFKQNPDSNGHAMKFANNHSTSPTKPKLVIRTDKPTVAEIRRNLLVPPTNAVQYNNTPGNRSPLVSSSGDSSSLLNTKEQIPSPQPPINKILIPPQFQNSQQSKPKIQPKPQYSKSHSPTKLNISFKPNPILLKTSPKPKSPTSGFILPPKPNSPTNKTNVVLTPPNYLKKSPANSYLTNSSKSTSETKVPPILTPPNSYTKSTSETKVPPILTPPNSCTKTTSETKVPAILTPPKPKFKDSNQLKSKVISPPRLEHTTNDDPTQDLTTTDATLARKIKPHKIIKIDPSQAAKYLQ